MSDVSTRGQSLSGLDGSVGLDVGVLTALMGVGGAGGEVGGPRLAGGQATVIVIPSGSGDQQLSDNQQPMTTVTKPIRRASMIYTSALPGMKHINISCHSIVIKRNLNHDKTICLSILHYSIFDFGRFVEQDYLK